MCEAMSTIISKELEKLAYDITKTCIIVDDTYKKQGKYTVLDGALKYDAYSSLTTLNIDDSVLVQIPKGDYSEQKTILNKLVDESININTNYLLPLDNMLKFTNNILKNQTENEQPSILANNEKISSKLLYGFNWKDYLGYDRMGVSFNIATRLNQYNVIRGSYGLKFSFIGEDIVREMDFGINDMTGNLYHFDTYINQQKLFDISQLQNISRLEIELYQNNDFYDIEGKLIPHTIEGDPILNIPEEDMNDNILLQDIEIFLGYAVDKFNGDQIILSADNLYYNKIDADVEDSKGVRDLNIKWIHHNGDGSYIIFDENDVYSKGLEIYWFRHVLNQVSEEYKNIAGSRNWSPNNFLGGLNSFTNSFKPNYEKSEESIMVVGRILDSNGEWVNYKSNILKFENELAIVDTLTYNAATQLSIHCLDESEGNYFIYDTSSSLINEGQGQGYVRQFEARYNGIRLNDSASPLKNITEIEWILPIDESKNTMLTYSDSYWEDRTSGEPDKINSTRTIKRKITAENINFIQNYSIKNNWNSSNSFNTVRCKVTADGNMYEATLDLQFGKAGTSGTNITLVLSYEDNKNAIGFTGESIQDCIIATSMYNSSGARIKDAKGAWTWDLYNSDKINKYVTIEPLQEGNFSRAKLTFNENYGITIPDDNYIIVQATFTPGDESEIIKTPVTAYLPIAFKKTQYSYIEGCRKVIYNSQGVPDYYSDAYSLYNSDQYEVDPKEITWKLKINNDKSITWNYNNEEPVISDSSYQWFNFKNLSKNNSFYPALVASPVYVKGGNDQVCLSAAINGSIVWSQPLLIMQSQYDYATLNEWNGALNIDEEGNKILSAMIATGKKEKDNSFSGILMGNVKTSGEGEDEDDVEQTGLYGISKGIISFSLTEQGVATFGGYGQGKIIIGKGDDISDSVNTITSANGEMFMDIDSGFINVSYGNNEKLSIGNSNLSNNRYLNFTDSNNNTILDFSKNNYIIQAVDPNKLKIDLKNGTLTTNSALSSSSLNTGDLVCNSLSAGSGNSYIGTTASGGYVINFGDFKVSDDGTVTYKGTELTNYIKNLISAAIPEGNN